MGWAFRAGEPCNDGGGISAFEIENYILHLHPITIPKLALLQSLKQNPKATTKKKQITQKTLQMTSSVLQAKAVHTDSFLEFNARVEPLRDNERADLQFCGILFGISSKINNLEIL